MEQSARLPRPGDERQRAVERLLAGLLEYAPDAIVVVDSSGIVLAVNANAENLFGHSREQMIGFPVARLIPERFGAGGKLWALHKDGRELPVDISLAHAPVADEVVVIASVRVPIAAELAAQLALRDRDRKLRGLFENAFQFIGLLAKDGSVLEANRTALNFIGCSREQVVGKPFWETPWWAHSAELANRLREAISEASEGAFVRFEAQHRGRDGRTMAIDFSLTPIRDDSGEVIYLIPEGRDITALKELEKLRSDYVHFLAHDLRNPVGTMGLHAEILQRGLQNMGMERLRQSIQVIVENIRRVDLMITGLLEEVRMEPGTTHLRLHPVRLRDLVTRVIAHGVGPSDVERIRIIEGAPVPPLLCDQQRIERVVQNLLTNAIKYAPAPSEIDVIIESDERDVRVSVRDHGPGLAAEDQRRVFEKYARLRPSAESLGLGLYICRLIVEAHGGRIWVDSVPQKGATFTFSLPLVPRAAASKSETQVSITAIPPLTAGHGRVLVVEDDEAACQALSQLLGDEGYEVVAAKSGSQALAELASFEPDVALVDLSMPVMNGAEFIGAARRLIADLPCILMTGQERSSAKVEALQIDGYVKKPVNFGLLLETIERVVRLKAALP